MSFQIPPPHLGVGHLHLGGIGRPGPSFAVTPVPPSSVPRTQPRRISRFRSGWPAQLMLTGPNEPVLHRVPLRRPGRVVAHRHVQPVAVGDLLLEGGLARAGGGGRCCRRRRPRSATRPPPDTACTRSGPTTTGSTRRRTPGCPTRYRHRCGPAPRAGRRSRRGWPDTPHRSGNRRH